MTHFGKDHQYIYGTGNDGRYHLGERPVSPILDGVYQAFGRLKKDSLVLDVGAGAMRVALNAPKQRLYNILGVEIDPVAVQQHDAAAVQPVGRESDRAVLGDITQFHLPPGAVDAAISWRVLHALSPEQQREVCKRVHETLVPGGDFYVSVTSDKDWKRQALAARGEYTPGKMHDSSTVMELDQPWMTYFFSEKALRALARETGFDVVGKLETFQEESGHDHLKDKPITYLFAHLRKPDARNQEMTENPTPSTLSVLVAQLEGLETIGDFARDPNHHIARTPLGNPEFRVQRIIDIKRQISEITGIPPSQIGS